MKTLILILWFIGLPVLCQAESFSYSTCKGDVDVREKPSQTSATLFFIPKDIKIQHSGKKGGWIEIGYIIAPDGRIIKDRSGWIPEKEICQSDTLEAASQ